MSNIKFQVEPLYGKLYDVVNYFKDVLSGAI